jgi:hypothetical protein
VTLHVQGDRTLGVVLTTMPTTAGSAQPGTYDLTVTKAVTGKKTARQQLHDAASRLAALSRTAHGREEAPEASRRA